MNQFNEQNGQALAVLLAAATQQQEALHPVTVAGKPAISWKTNPEHMVHLVSQAYASETHMVSKGIDTHWQNIAALLNETTFRNYRSVDGPAYKKQYNAFKKEIAAKYATNVPGTNLSGLQESAPPADKIMLKILEETYQKRNERADLTTSEVLKGNSSLTVENGILGTNFTLAPVPGMTATSIAENGANTRSGYSSSSASPSPPPSSSAHPTVIISPGGTKPPKDRVRKFEALEDPLVTIMNRYLLLEEKKLQMELDREARLEARRNMMD